MLCEASLCSKASTAVPNPLSAIRRVTQSLQMCVQVCYDLGTTNNRGEGSSMAWQARERNGASPVHARSAPALPAKETSNPRPPSPQQAQLAMPAEPPGRGGHAGRPGQLLSEKAAITAPHLTTPSARAPDHPALGPIPHHTPLTTFQRRATQPSGDMHAPKAPPRAPGANGTPRPTDWARAPEPRRSTTARRQARWRPGSEGAPQF